MRKLLLILLAGALLFLPFCGKTKSEKIRVIILGFDGADWDFIEPLMARGYLPNFKRLRQQGAWARLRSMKPTLSAVIWTTIATGKTMEKHGIIDWVYVKKHGIKIPYTATERREPAIWEILNEYGKSSAVINWFVTYPPDHIKGIVVSSVMRDYVLSRKKNALPRDAVYPPKYYPLIKKCMVRNFKKALSEMGIPDYRKMAEEMGADPSKLPIISSFRVFVLMEKFTENVGEMVWKRGDYDLFALYFRWPDVITHFSGMFIKDKELVRKALTQIRKEHKLDPEIRNKLDQEDARILLPVYRWLDGILGRYMERAKEKGAYLIVLSDHGFDLGPEGYNHELPDWMEPPLGILGIMGPGVKKGYEIRNASVYDIAPTVLYLYGLPIGKDMDGMPLLDAFKFSRKLRYRKFYRRKFVKKHIRELDEKTLKELHSLGYI